MYRYIKKAAQAFEDDTSKESILGAKICTVSVIVMIVGWVIGLNFNKIAGGIIATLGIVSNFYGVAIYLSGYIKKIKKDREAEKIIRDKYENPKQPWE